MTYPPIPERVAAGARWLDDNYPNWLDKILHPIDMVHTRNCLLGQVFGTYWGAPGADCDGSFDRWAIDHGFQARPIDGIPNAHDNDEYDELGEAWTELIDSRRATAEVTPT